MQRTKKLVAALAAAMALVAIAGAPSAFAGYFQVTGGGAYTASSTVQEFTQGGGIAGNCTSGGNFAGTVANLDEELGDLPADMSCSSSNEGAFSWKWNGCEVTLQPGDDGSPLNGTFSIGGCASVQLNSASCEKRIAPQSGTATFTNEGGSVKATATGSLSYTVVKSGGSCKNGAISYTGKWTVTPTAGGSLSALTSKVGLFHEASQFFAQTPAYPVNVSGGQVPSEQHAVSLPGGRVLKCASVELSGQLVGPSSTLALAPQYANCTTQVGETILPAVVDPGSCAYQVAAASTLGVSCQSEGDGVEISVFQSATKQAEGVPMCVYNIGPQSGIAGIALSNTGEGVDAGVELDFGGSKLAHTRTTGTPGNCGSAKSTVSYAGSSVLHGVMD